MQWPIALNALLLLSLGVRGSNEYQLYAMLQYIEVAPPIDMVAKTVGSFRVP